MRSKEELQVQKLELEIRELSRPFWARAAYLAALLPDAPVRAIAAKLEPLTFEQIYGAWWGTTIPDGHAAVQRSAERYARALHGELG